MKLLIALATLLLVSSPSLAQRTWILLENSYGSSKKYVDMQSVVIKDGKAYFNTGHGYNSALPLEQSIDSVIMNCRTRSHEGGAYIPAPVDLARGNPKRTSNVLIQLDRENNEQLEMVCPDEILSKDFKEALYWIEKL